MRIHVIMDKLEELRKKYKLLHIICLVVGLLIGIPMIYYTVTQNTGIEFFGAFVLGAVIIVPCGNMIMKVKKDFNELYKGTFAAATMEEMLDDVQYDWKRGFSPEEVREFRLSPMGNRYYSEDYLKATYKGVQFEQADVVIKYESNTGKNKTTKVYFKGRMMNFDISNKKVFDLQIFSRYFNYRAGTDYAMNKVELEDVEFNEMFDVFSAYPEEAFYMLTPHFMECLKELHKNNPSLSLRFRSGKLYVGFYTNRSSFDPHMGSEINYPQEMARMKADIQNIIDIVETLGLENQD